jgi:hypothetical protein
MEKQVEVFGTKEVSIKEFMGASDKSLMLLSDFDMAKANLVALNLKHSIRVSELSENKNFDAIELKELVSIRAELREPRYLIQKIEKNNVSVFESYKKKDKANLKELIDLNVSLEDSVDALIKFEEKRKEIEKEAERVAEQNRIETIEKKISDFESDSYKIIQETNIGNVELHKSMLDAFVNEEFDYEEYEIMFEQARIRVQSYWDNKCSEVQEKEQQRLENERLKEINLEIERKSKELQDRLDAEQREREFKEMQQKGEQFEIRKNRLDEIGVVLTPHNGFSFVIYDIENINEQLVFNASITEFESILLNAKNQIKEAKEHIEIVKQQLKEAQELELLLKEKAEKQKAIDLELSKKDAERLKKENAARVKRLAKDKDGLQKSIFYQLVELTIKEDILENAETKTFLLSANIQIEKLKSDLLIQLNDL